jgi:hypothetical protein
MFLDARRSRHSVDGKMQTVAETRGSLATWTRIPKKSLLASLLIKDLLLYDQTRLSKKQYDKGLVEILKRRQQRIKNRTD